MIKYHQNALISNFTLGSQSATETQIRLAATSVIAAVLQTKAQKLQTPCPQTGQRVRAKPGSGNPSSPPTAPGPTLQPVPVRKQDRLRVLLVLFFLMLERTNLPVSALAPLYPRRRQRNRAPILTLIFELMP